MNAVLNAAADKLERVQHAQGAYAYDYHGKPKRVMWAGDDVASLDLIGAIRYVTGNESKDGDEAVALLRTHIPGDLATWNDEHTKAECVSALRKAGL